MSKRVVMYLLPFLVALSMQDSPRNEITRPGTYSLLICRDGCRSDTNHAYVRGTVVLEPRAFKLNDLPSDVRSRLERAYRDAQGPWGASVNGCFAVTGSRSDSYAGINRVGFLHWLPNTDRLVTIELYRSPDAGYDITLSARQDTLRGFGRSWGAGAAEIHAATDSVVAWRVGPPRRQLCVQAARRACTQC